MPGETITSSTSSTQKPKVKMGGNAGIIQKQSTSRKKKI